MVESLVGLGVMLLYYQYHLRSGIVLGYWINLVSLQYLIFVP